MTVGGETAGEQTEMGNVQKKFPKRAFEKKEEADQTPKHNKASNQNGVKNDGGNLQAKDPPEGKTKPGHGSTQAPTTEVTSRTGSQGDKLSSELLSPSARLKAQGNQLFKNGQFGEAAVKYSEAIENLKNTGQFFICMPVFPMTGFESDSDRPCSGYYKSKCRSEIR